MKQDICIYYIPPPLTVHFPMTRSVRYQPILHTLYYTLHTEHAYCLSYRFLNNVVITTVIEMVEMDEILDGRLGKRSVERVRYVINNLLHLVIVKYGDISLVLCIFLLICACFNYKHGSPSIVLFLKCPHQNFQSLSELKKINGVQQCVRLLAPLGWRHCQIYIAYYTSKSGIWRDISRVASYFHEPKASATTAYE